MARSRWWVFDLPLRRDPLFLLGLLLGVFGLVGVIASADEYGTGALVVTLLTTIPLAVLSVGVVLGSVREFLRGRRASA